MGRAGRRDRRATLLLDVRSGRPSEPKHPGTPYDSRGPIAPFSSRARRAAPPAARTRRRYHHEGRIARIRVSARRAEARHPEFRMSLDEIRTRAVDIRRRLNQIKDSL